MMKRSLTIITVVVVAALLVLVGATTMTAAQPTTQQPPVNQWQMKFYPGLDWAGYPVYTQYSNSLNYNWGTGSPGPNVPASYWSMKATIYTYFYGGEYRFSILADDEFIFKVDNVTYMNTINAGLSGKTVVVTVPVSQGYHTVELDYRQFTGPAYLYTSLDYVKPGPGPAPTPVPPLPDRPLPAPMVPPSATSVQTKYGDFTPCIQQGLHQSECFHSDGAWNSPDVGSIQMEPKITVWGNCEPADTDVTWTVDTTTDPMITKDFRCSKTLAGWFER
jgi:hypothetical protein